MTECRAIDLGVIPYREAFLLQKQDVMRIKQGDSSDVLYLLEHPHVFTIGRNASVDAITADHRLIESRGVEIVETDRGGDVTYHGPGQLVGYPLFALEESRRDIRRFVFDLEAALIDTLRDFGIAGERHPEHRGVWTEGRKIASIGIRISRWVTCHGFALNVGTDLSYFDLMTPCGIDGVQMTSIANETGANEIGTPTGTIDMAAVKESVATHIAHRFDRNMSVLEKSA